MRYEIELMLLDNCDMMSTRFTIQYNPHDSKAILLDLVRSELRAVFFICYIESARSKSFLGAS